MLPQARKEGLLVQEVDGELVIYDEGSHKAHHLNRSAGLVWRNCDGTRTIEELAAVLRRELDATDAFNLVQLALTDLEEAHLIIELPAKISADPVITRREFFEKAKVAAILIPVVTS